MWIIVAFLALKFGNVDIAESTFVGLFWPIFIAGIILLGIIAAPFVLVISIVNTLNERY